MGYWRPDRGGLGKNSSVVKFRGEVYPFVVKNNRRNVKKMEKLDLFLCFGFLDAFFGCELNYNDSAFMRNKKNHSPYTIPSITGTMIS